MLYVRFSNGIVFDRAALDRAVRHAVGAQLGRRNAVVPTIRRAQEAQIESTVVVGARFPGRVQPPTRAAAAGRDADHPGHRLRTVGRLRTPKHLDALDVGGQQVGEVDRAAGDRVHPHAVDEDQGLRTRAAAHADGCDLARASGMSHLGARHRAEQVEHRHGVAPFDLFAVDHRDRAADLRSRHLVAVRADDDLFREDRRLVFSFVVLMAGCCCRRQQDRGCHAVDPPPVAPARAAATASGLALSPVVHFGPSSPAGFLLRAAFRAGGAVVASAGSQVS